MDETTIKSQTRAEAFANLETLIKNQNLIKHHLAAEAAMREIALYLKTKSDLLINEDDWAIVGLLHDADYEITHDKPARHTIELEERLGKTLKPEIMYAIKSHNWKHNGIEPKSLMDWAIYTCDELTGIIIAAALISPDKNLANLTSDFILKRIKERSFAKSVDRKQISVCEEKLGIPLSEYVQLVLVSMQKIAPSLGL